MKKVSLLGVGAVLAATAIALSGCTGGAPASNSGSNQITYLIGQPDTPAQLTALKADMKNFEKESGVTVKLNVLPSDTIRTVLQTQLRSGSGPDVFGYDTGAGFAGVLAKAGLLYDLTAEYSKKNYAIYDFAKKAVTFDNKITGIPDQIEEVGLYYNKDMFAKQGLSAPTSLPDLEASLAKLKASGVIPMAAAEKEGYEAGWYLSMALASRAGADTVKGLIAGTGDWSSQDVVDAIDSWKQLNEKGYLPPSVTSIASQNGDALFLSGKAAMYPSGTWLVQTIDSTAKFNAGFIPFPGPDDKGISTTGLGGGIFMSANSKNPKAALKLMDYLASPEHGKYEISQGLIPTFPVSTDGIKVSPLFQQVLTDTAAYAKGTGQVGQNIDVAETDVFNKAMWDGFQAVFNGTMTPTQMAKSLQKASTTK
ncbi:MAG: raffinose/stachyose/melibiose transport system substrate-binding protein [Actinomycetota bacterium]|jgi:raffinose/stachyose/melibiose transport system substrate-binding protein|nr:raffinose/stachyose/melibiose transport system substrate-binding protein [Actinomycetota bacterium]